MKQFLKFAHSVQGANHIRDGKVCQDASGCYEDSWMSIVAVADGHGSDNYPRTDRGSKFAVESALEAIEEFVRAAGQDGIDVVAEQKARLHDLELNLLRRWHDRVEQDLETDPFRETELERVSQRYKDIYHAEEDARHKKAYGTTLIAICATAKYWFGLQIGDGKCFAIDQNGVCTEPIPWDENCHANITTSICDSDALDEFRFFCGKDFPLAVFIGSDGVDDSYGGDDELHDLYRAIFCIFAESGFGTGISEIRNFLPTMSDRGSGDDVSMAGLIRAEVRPEVIQLVRCQQECKTAERSLRLLDRLITITKEKLDSLRNAVPDAGIAERRERFEAEYERFLAERREAQEASENAKRHLEEAEAAFRAAGTAPANTHATLCGEKAEEEKAEAAWKEKELT